MNTEDIIKNLLKSKLELIDEQAVEQFWFSKDSYVSATIGIKNGPVCGPLWNYQITNNGAINIKDYDGQLKYKWENIQIENDLLSVLCDGQTKKYKITKNK